MRHLVGRRNIDPLVRQIAYSRCKPEAEDRADGKDMIREAARISIMLADLSAGVI